MKKNIRKKLLLSWSNMYIFDERIVPLIPSLAKEFDIYIVLTPTHSYIVDLLSPIFKKWEEDGVIIKVYIGPNFVNLLSIHYFLNKLTKTLKKLNFDMWITNCISFPELYIYHNVISKKTYKVALSTNTTALNYYLSNFSIDEDEYKEKLNFKSLLKLKEHSQSKKQLNRSLMVNIKRKFRLIIPFILDKISIRILKYFYKNEYIFNELNSSINQFTSFGNNVFDQILFQTEMEAEAHRHLFQSENINTKCSVIDFSIDNCTCDIKAKKKGVLFTTTIYVGEDDTPYNYKIDILKSLETIQNEFGKKKFYFRKHPAENGKWVDKLVKYLIQNKIEAYILNEEYKPLRKIVCDYEIVVSDGSASLRDVLFDCQNIISIILEKPASYIIDNAKIFFANTDKLSWINKEYIYEAGVIYHKNQINICTLNELALCNNESFINKI